MADIKFEEKKIKLIISKIYKLESKNSRTGTLTDKKMQEEIVKIIKEVVDRCY